MLGHESFCFDCFDEVESLIPISFINSVDKYDYAYLLTFKQLEDGYHMYTRNSIEINISYDPIDATIIYLGDVLGKEERVKATTLLKKYAKIFMFGYQDMLGTNPNIFIHNIITKLDTKLVKQKLRRISPTQSLQIKEEFHKILDANFISLLITHSGSPKWFMLVSQRVVLDFA